MLLMIDNYDSFTYNLVQYLGELGADVEVVRNDAVTADEVLERAPSHVVVSPGPCSPNEAGQSMAIIRECAGRIPLLGVCLGHQCIGQVYGATVGHAKAVMHGKTSAVHHRGTDVFRGLTDPFTATRYHSLVIEPGTLSEAFEVTAWTVDDEGGLDEIMGIAHREWPLYGVQFHPESILTESGHALLQNFLNVRADP
jgi:anthranilate synthase component 2